MRHFNGSVIAAAFRRRSALIAGLVDQVHNREDLFGRRGGYPFSFRFRKIFFQIPQNINLLEPAIHYPSTWNPIVHAAAVPKGNIVPQGAAIT
jgi:hypothetical protein